ncbi:MAG TPA: hypothetical protein VK668_14460 [Mucilaginibacter sp.]|nr:hypothetical protein [Mucilaginibacter sp.]
MRRSTVILLLFCLGCSHKSNKINIDVSLTDSNRSITIKGFDKAIIADIGRDTSNAVWQSLLPVYRMPADTDMKDYQNEQPGNYLVKDSVVVFTPDTAFKKDQAYFVRYYQYDTNPDALHLIRDKKRPGNLSYTDLTFKY